MKSERSQHIREDSLASISPMVSHGSSPFEEGLSANDALPQIALVLDRLWWQMLCKRAIDIIGALFCIIVLGPVILLVAALVKLTSEGSVLYKSVRVGEGGTLFTLYKFRTMVKNADELKNQLVHLNERQGVLFKIAADPRITSCGRFMRRYSLDELPQLWNVLRGNMSLVGPRPPTVDEFKKYDRYQIRRMSVKPGITGLWQIEARSDPSFERYVKLDLLYIDTWSLWLDFKILLNTFGAVLRGTGT